MKTNIVLRIRLVENQSLYKCWTCKWSVTVQMVSYWGRWCCVTEGRGFL